MKAVSYYRGLVYYFKKCLINDEEGLAKIQNMDLVNPHPMEIRSSLHYIYDEFVRWFDGLGLEGIINSDLINNDYGYSFLRDKYKNKLVELLELNQEESDKIFIDESLFKSSMEESYSMDGFRTLFFFIFSFHMNKIHMNEIDSALNKYKPTSKYEYPFSYQKYKMNLINKLDFKSDSYDNILNFIEEDEYNLYLVWKNYIPKTLFDFVLTNPSFWDGYEKGSIKVFRVNPLGIDLERYKRPGMYWDCLMALITGHKVTFKEKDIRWDLKFDKVDDKHLSIDNGNKIRFKSNSIEDFLHTPFKGRTVDNLLKKTIEARILY